jgi:hypothetical protein
MKLTPEEEQLILEKRKQDQKNAWQPKTNYTDPKFSKQFKDCKGKFMVHLGNFGGKAVCGIEGLICSDIRGVTCPRCLGGKDLHDVPSEIINQKPKENLLPEMMKEFLK